MNSIKLIRSVYPEILVFFLFSFELTFVREGLFSERCRDVSILLASTFNMFSIMTLNLIHHHNHDIFLSTITSKV